MSLIVCHSGNEIKARGNDILEGALITYGSPDQTDLSQKRDFFTKDTIFGTATGGNCMYHHGLDTSIKKTIWGATEYEDRETNKWVKFQVKLADKYQKALHKAIKGGYLKAGWSSGTSPHTTVREAVKNSKGETVHEIKQWILGVDDSITPQPAEYRNVVEAKSLGGIITDFETWEVKALLAESTEEDNEAKALSLDDLSRSLHRAWRDLARREKISGRVVDSLPNLTNLLEGTVIISINVADWESEYHEVGYQISEAGQVTFASRKTWLKVQRSREWIEAKSALWQEIYGAQALGKAISEEDPNDADDLSELTEFIKGIRLSNHLGRSQRDFRPTSNTA